MPLPNPSMAFFPFDPLPASQLNDLVENIEALQDFTAFDDDTFPARLVADYSISPPLWNNPFCFRATASTQTSLLDNTATKINLATEVYDYNNNFAASTYTAPRKGVYNFSGAVSHVSASVSPVIAYSMIYVNGSERARSSSATASTVPIYSYPVASDVLLNANDTVELYHLQDSGGSETAVDNAVLTWFSGHLIHAIP